MSRLGKKPVEMPPGVKAAVANGLVNIEGPKGKLAHQIGMGVNVVVEGGKIVVSPTASDPQSKANFGTTRALVKNMVDGVSTGWKRSLELSGVGYKANVSGQVLNLTVGLSHEVKFTLPKEIKATVDKNVTILLESADRQLLGNIAAKIRKVRPPEPYLGKGIKFSEETIRRKAGKAGKKA